VDQTLSYLCGAQLQVRNSYRLYYHNARTGESQWDKPDVLKSVQVGAGSRVCGRQDDLRLRWVSQPSWSL
jgi:WW domain